MRKILVGGFIVAIVAYVLYSIGGKSVIIPTPRVNQPQSVPQVNSQKTQKLIFVPYWQMTNPDEVRAGVESYDRIVYFGVSATEEGVDKSEPGYVNLDIFSEIVGGKKAYLTLRMINPDINASVLENERSWPYIMQDTIDIASTYGFEGVVLDLEYVSIFNHDTVQAQITRFMKQFVDRAHKANLSFAITLYGDVYYRRRPYDVGSISQTVDEIMVMGYDFHKRTGTSGPNFPLADRAQFGYDMQTLAQDLGQAKTKVTMLFGMYGYDWVVDAQKRPIKAATAMTLVQIKNEYVANCEKLNCVFRRDPKAAENEINFVDSDAQYHIIWYEDEESVEKKKEYLKLQGISSFGYWAYGYF